MMQKLQIRNVQSIQPLQFTYRAKRAFFVQIMKEFSLKIEFDSI